MELKVVYRILRQISDWTLAGFYSEVSVEGHENVPKQGPVILVSTHHNEIIDIAALAATIPHRRHVSFWAKSTMFANPVFRWVLVSSNTIPVRRNPDKVLEAAKAESTSMFKETCIALDEGRVIGVFPEGTSYTQPGIMQIKEGAGWAAAEYSKWASSRSRDTPLHGSQMEAISSGDELQIIPVAIVYTDKARYQSKVSVRYGEPMFMSDYTGQVAQTGASADMQNTKLVVKELMRDIEHKLKRMAVISPDWETLYASRTASDILWGSSDNIPLEKFTQISQMLVDLFSPAQLASDPSLQRVKAPLTKYLALLQYTGITHESLSAALPLRISAAQSLKGVSTNPSRFAALRVLMRAIFLTVLHPRTLLSLPALLAHLPAYLLGSLSAKLLSTPGEEETIAEFKTIFGGIGVALGTGVFGFGAQRLLSQGYLTRFLKMYPTLVSQSSTFYWLDALQEVLEGSQGFGRKWIAKLGLIYGISWALVRWHSCGIKGNYRRYQLLLTSLKLFFGSWLRARMPDDVLALYAKPALPPRNPFLEESVEDASEPEEKAPPLSRLQRLALVRYLLSARSQAYGSLLEVLQDTNHDLRDRLTAVGWLENMMV